MSSYTNRALAGVKGYHDLQKGSEIMAQRNNIRDCIYAGTFQPKVCKSGPLLSSVWCQCHNKGKPEDLLDLITALF